LLLEGGRIAESVPIQKQNLLTAIVTDVTSRHTVSQSATVLFCSMEMDTGDINSSYLSKLMTPRKILALALFALAKKVEPSVRLEDLQHLELTDL